MVFIFTGLFLLDYVEKLERENEELLKRRSSFNRSNHTWR